MASPEALQNAAIATAGILTNSMNDFAQQAVNFAQPASFWVSQVAPSNPVEGFTGSIPDLPADVNLSDITASRPINFAALFNSIDFDSELSVGNIPTFDLLMVEPNIPVAPSTDLPSAPGNAPELVAPALPDEQPWHLPDAPTFEPIAIPVMPAFQNYEFNEVLGSDSLLAPTETFVWNEAQYQSVFLDALKTKLYNDLINGGYGIDDADEQRLWDRARERELLGAEAAIQDAMRQAAARGFSMPPGAAQTLAFQAQQTALEKSSSLSRDIMSKKADLYVQNRQFTITASKDVEQMIITAYGYFMERAMNAAKSVVELGIASFNARLAVQNYRLERYKAAASVFETLIRSVLAKVEIYKASVEAAKAGADMQRIYSEVYRTQIEGVQALINVYRTRVEAAKIKADIELSRLEGFKVSVDAYTAQVQAKSAEFGMFESQIKGEMTKVQIYQTQVQSYATQVEAYKAAVSAKEIAVRGKMDWNKLELDTYRTDIQRYTAELQASQAQTTLEMSRYEANLKKFSVVVDATMRQSQQGIDAGKANADVTTARASIAATSSLHAAQILASRAAATSNTMASLSGAYGSAAAAALSSATGIIASVS